MFSSMKCTTNQLNSHPATTLSSLPPTLADRPRKSRHVEATGEVSAYACLVVSADPLSQLMFGRSAARTGWSPIACADAAAALKHLPPMVVGAPLVAIHTQAEHHA